MKYLVRQFFVVEVEVEAEDAAHAKEVAGCHDTQYEIVTRFTDPDRDSGPWDAGPDIERAAIDDEVLPLEAL